MTRHRRSLTLSGGVLMLLSSGCSSTFNSAIVGQSFDPPGPVPEAAPGGKKMTATEAPFGDDDLEAPVRLAADDVIHFAIVDHPELQYSATVQPDGTVELPIVGSIKAAGMTPSELRAAAKERLAGRMQTSQVLLQPGDVIRMLVFQQPELTDVAIVQLDGMVVLPLVGEVKTAGRPIVAIQKEVERRLRTILVNAQVSILAERLALNSLANAEISVLPERLAPRQVIVLGEVLQPGVYPIHSHMRVMTVLAQAHNLETAQINDVIVIRDRLGGKPKFRSLRLSDYAAAKAADQNIMLMADDIVIVPKSPIAVLDTFIDQFFTRTIPVFNWWISLQDASVAADYAKQVHLVNQLLRGSSPQ